MSAAFRELPRREVARVAVQDPEGRVLLVRHTDGVNGWWVLPGGARLEGESFESAAERELLEETGLKATLSTKLFSRQLAGLQLPDGPVNQVERFFAASIPVLAPPIDLGPLAASEGIDAFRWWTLADLATTSETVYPADLMRHLRAGLRWSPSIRPVGATDVEACLALWHVSNTARRGGRPPHEAAAPRVRTHLERDTFFPLLMEDAGEPVAFTAAGQAVDIDGDLSPIAGLCHIALVFVTPERWGEGIGRAIMSATLNEATERGLDRAQLWTHADNKRSQQLYESLGFLPTGDRKPDQDEGEDMIRLEAQLP